ELQGYLSGESRIPGINAIPGAGTNVPIYILGSSLFGAKLAAMLGLPYGFASHFAPAALHQAIELYRSEFEPSEQLAEPYVIAGVNVLAADTEEEAQAQHLHVSRARVAIILGRDRSYTDEEADTILASAHGHHVREMTRCTAVGTPDVVRRSLLDFAEETGADELITAHYSDTVPNRLRSVELLAGALDPAGA
ncbi:MAG TPA: LLM class flavin-dependent oxidoreductase, partial [Solirubrobacterales bacterium]|nr:LLM class flavin-dependent oxidoreductase [Solirubrobacterales bacterium]